MLRRLVGKKGLKVWTLPSFELTLRVRQVSFLKSEMRRADFIYIYLIL